MIDPSSSISPPLELENLFPPVALDSWDSEWMKACCQGDLFRAQHLYTVHPERMTINERQKGFRTACEWGALKVAQWLVSIHPADQGLLNIHDHQSMAFRWACEAGQWPVVKWLACDPSLKAMGYEWVDVNVMEGWGLRYACETGSLDVVKGLLMDPDLKAAGQCMDLVQYAQACARAAIRGGQLHVLDFLVFSEELVQADQQRVDVPRHAYGLYEEIALEGSIEAWRWIENTAAFQAAGVPSMDWNALEDQAKIYLVDVACRSGCWDFVRILLNDKSDLRTLAEETLKSFDEGRLMLKILKEHELLSCCDEERLTKKAATPRGGEANSGMVSGKKGLRL